MLKFTLKYLIFALTCFGPPGLSWCRTACESHAVRHPVHTPQPETHATTTLHYL